MSILLIYSQMIISFFFFSNDTYHSLIYLPSDAHVILPLLNYENTHLEIPSFFSSKSKF